DQTIACFNVHGYCVAATAMLGRQTLGEAGYTGAFVVDNSFVMRPAHVVEAAVFIVAIVDCDPNSECFGRLKAKIISILMRRRWRASSGSLFEILKGLRCSLFAEQFVGELTSALASQPFVEKAIGILHVNKLLEQLLVSNSIVEHAVLRQGW